MDIKYELFKNKIIFKQGKITLPIAIPQGFNRIDFIDRNFKYHYNYKGVLNHGFLIIIKSGIPQVKFIKLGNLDRLRNLDRLHRYNNRGYKSSLNLSTRYEQLP